MGEPNSVKWMFDKRGVILVEKSLIDENRLMELGLEAGADDVVDQDSVWEVTSQPAAFLGVRAAIEKAGIVITSAEVTMIPQNSVPVDGGDAKKILKMIDAMEEHDDVQAVYANFDIPESVLAEV